jgi:hypothetical protein
VANSIAPTSASIFMKSSQARLDQSTGQGGSLSPEPPSHDQDKHGPYRAAYEAPAAGLPRVKLIILHCINPGEDARDLPLGGPLP